MNVINWPQFGLKENPYASKPLTEGGSLPIEKAFIGRKKEIAYVRSLCINNNNINLVIGGDVGVGKTSLMNFLKYAFKYYEKQKPLFSFRREIEVTQENMNKRIFLLEIIGSIIREIQLIDPTLIKKHALLQRMQKLIDMYININMSAGLSGSIEPIQAGLNVGKSTSTEQPAFLPMTMLEKYFFELMTFIRKHKISGKNYQGLIVHVNNFDALLQEKDNKKKIIAFFNEIRDLLQTEHLYSVFLGPSSFFQDIIAPQQRIKGIFILSPLELHALSKQELIQVFDERLKLATSDTVLSIIKPFEDEVIARLYDLYNGDIRSVMNALQDILGQTSLITKTLPVDKAMFLLGRERWMQLELTANLTTEQTEILKYLAASDNDVTQKELVASLNKTKESMSGYYFKTLKEHGIIEEKEKIGTTKYWGLTEQYYPISFLFKKSTN